MTLAVGLLVVAAAAVVVGTYWLQDQGSARSAGPSGEVFDTVSQRDIGWGFAGHLWLEEVDASDEYLARDQAMEHYRDHYPELDLREPAQLVRMESDLEDDDGNSMHPYRGQPALMEPLWAFVIDVPEPPPDSDLPPAEEQIRVLYLDARTGEFAQEFEGVKKDPGREHPDGWRE